jgi:hypothetical protein
MEITKSESIAKLIGALIKAKGTFTRPKKDADNPFLKKKYADLNSCLEACEGPLNENGLTLLQFPGRFVDSSLSLSTILAHVSGEWIAAEMSIPLGKVDPQGAGSAITYARRYALCAALSLCPGDDTDGEIRLPKKKDSSPYITADQWNRIKAECSASRCSPRKLLGAYACDTPKTLSTMHYEDAINRAKHPTPDLMSPPVEANSTP